MLRLFQFSFIGLRFCVEASIGELARLWPRSLTNLRRHILFGSVKSQSFRYTKEQLGITHTR